MNTIEWKIKAHKQLKKIHPTYQQAIVKAVDGLANFPEENRNVKPLSNHRYDYRLRVGRYRVLFDHKETITVITIQEVKKRDEQTY
ncbi:MAG: type II toxin-antitoxin system RelE/ParE family toxin [Deltaproteobacteria bacterium]|nr:type II toxin-antitoxin system RelE/ParE family toxin [Deltaproteobacteria bacterium]